MPTYSTRCPGCGARDTVYRKVDERDSRLPVCDCGAQVARVLDKPWVAPDIAPYVSPATGELVNSRSTRRVDLAKSGCIEWEPGIKEAIARRREERWEETLAAVDKKVDDVVRDFAASGRLS